MWSSKPRQIKPPYPFILMYEVNEGAHRMLAKDVKRYGTPKGYGFEVLGDEEFFVIYW